ncbi:helix-turn-helix domain-containing protein [Streptomyces sp. NPDC059708]|uniref:helix-turn-helix domain-containing protein n=1 Tax=Streptomyces sp. NPDC059708 TaxID=3346916 RepID=UPI0036B19FB3
MTSAGPRRLQIATGLAKLRDRSGLTLEELARTSGYGKSTVGRYEDWRSPSAPVARTVRAIATAAGGTPDEVAALVRLTEDMSEGWWLGEDSAVPDWMHPLVVLEAEADYEYVFALSAVPGLLQTRAYAEAIHLTGQARKQPEEVSALVDSRMRRQEVLIKRRPLHLWVILDQAVLRRVVGSHGVMAEQISHLIDQAQRPNVDIQVLPWEAGAHAAGKNAFLTLGTRDALGAVYVELLDGGLYKDSGEDVHKYTVAMDYLRMQAADTTESLHLLNDAHKEHTAHEAQAKR